MQYANPFQLTFHLAAFVIIGLAVIAIVALKPKYFWPILIIVTIGTAGVMTNQYTFIDEYLIACVLLGIFMARSIKAFPFKSNRTNSLSSLHRWIFFIMVIYLIAESLRGMVVLESLRKFRWIVYHGVLGILSFVISRRNIYVPSNRKICLIILISALIYFCMYIANGLFNELVRGISRYSMQVQTREWGTSAYSMFPLVIAMPAIILIFKDRSHIYRLLGRATLIIVIFAAFYYDSRVSLVAILFFLIISTPVLGVGRIVCYSLIFVLIFWLLVLFLWPQNREIMKYFIHDLFGFVNIILDPDQSSADVDRYIYMRVAFVPISKSLVNFLFGYGYHVYGFVISPYVANLFAQYAPYTIVSIKEDVAAEAFTGHLVDTGVVGMLLLGMNFLCVYRKISQQKNPNRIVLLACLFMMVFWSFVSNFRDMVIAYIAIMPSGLLIQLSRFEVEEPVKGKNQKISQ